MVCGVVQQMLTDSCRIVGTDVIVVILLLLLIFIHLHIHMLRLLFVVLFVHGALLLLMLLLPPLLLSLLWLLQLLQPLKLHQTHRQSTFEAQKHSKVNVVADDRYSYAAVSIKC